MTHYPPTHKEHPREVRMKEIRTGTFLFPTRALGKLDWIPGGVIMLHRRWKLSGIPQAELIYVFLN